MTKILTAVVRYFTDDCDDTLWLWRSSLPYCMACYSLNDSL